MDGLGGSDILHAFLTCKVLIFDSYFVFFATTYVLKQNATKQVLLMATCLC